MIVTNVGGLPQMVPEHAGLHCNPDAPSIATTIDRFFVLGSGHFAEGIKSEKQKLSWTVFTDSLLGLADTL
jgi:hypothetical protein